MIARAVFAIALFSTPAAFALNFQDVAMQIKSGLALTGGESNAVGIFNGDSDNGCGMTVAFWKPNAVSVVISDGDFHAQHEFGAGVLFKFETTVDGFRLSSSDSSLIVEVSERDAKITGIRWSEKYVDLGFIPRTLKANCSVLTP